MSTAVFYSTASEILAFLSAAFACMAVVLFFKGHLHDYLALERGRRSGLYGRIIDPNRSEARSTGRLSDPTSPLEARQDNRKKTNKKTDKKTETRDDRSAGSLRPSGRAASYRGRGPDPHEREEDDPLTGLLDPAGTAETGLLGQGPSVQQRGKNGLGTEPWTPHVVRNSFRIVGQILYDAETAAGGTLYKKAPEKDR